MHTLARFCCKDPDIAVSCETRPGPSKHRSGCSQSAIGWNTGPPIEELEKIPKIQFTKPMKLKEKEDQSVDTTILLRIGNKTPMEGVTETKFVAVTKGWTI